MSDKPLPNIWPNVYANMLPRIREVARSLGYAIGVHGSMVNDCDLIAVPWVETQHPTTCSRTRSGTHWKADTHFDIRPYSVTSPHLGHLGAACRHMVETHVVRHSSHSRTNRPDIGSHPQATTSYPVTTSRRRPAFDRSESSTRSSRDGPVSNTMPKAYPSKYTRAWV